MYRHRRIVAITFLLLGPLFSLGPSAIPAPAGDGSASPRQTGYGLSTLAAPDRLDRAKAIGFNWVKLLLAWKGVQPTAPNSFDWSALDQDIDRASGRGMRILLRVDQPPSWASGSNAYNAPPIDERTFGDFMGALAARYRGRIAAYEIWNEPNTSLEWGGRTPDPAKFAAMLRDLYPKVKAADPQAIVVTGGVATTGDGGAGDAWGDLAYLRAIYQNGGKGSFDAVGSHPYGGPYSPETGRESAGLGVYFRRAEEHRAVVEQFADNAAVWPTEVGWLYNQSSQSCRLESYDPYHAAWQVSEAVQADYLVRAFRFAADRWPWSGPLFVYNQDFSVDPWRVDCDPNRFFSIVRRDGTPLQAYLSLGSMSRYETSRPNVAFRNLLPVVSATSFVLNWVGSDSGSGLASYDVQVRSGGGTTWTDLAMNVADSSLEIDVDNHEKYVFRVRPMDWAGNRGDWRETGPITVSLDGYLLAVPAGLNLFAARTSGLAGQLVLRNVGGSPLSWSAKSDAPWPSLQPASGHIGQGLSNAVTLTMPVNQPLGVLSASITLSSTAWQTSSPIPIRVHVVDNVRTVFVPGVLLGDAAVTPAGAATQSRIRLQVPK